MLWFGAYKNAQCYYAPAWVKRDIERFRRAQMVPGQNKVRYAEFHNFEITALSLYCEETRAADAGAYAALMAHLREVDAQDHTVILVQVENECGQMVAAREHSPWADAAFAESVPTELIEALAVDPTSLASELAEALEAGAGSGSWEQVFGEHAEEMFTTYHMARYVEAVAAAGRAEHPLSTACNCWLDKGHKPGRFPTGGPNLRVMGVWKHAAPSIDMLGPDIYIPAFCKVCDGYAREDNPLFIPETATHAYAARAPGLGGGPITMPCASLLLVTRRWASPLAIRRVFSLAWIRATPLCSRLRTGRNMRRSRVGWLSYLNLPRTMPRTRRSMP